MLKAIKNRLIISPIERSETTESGIYVGKDISESKDLIRANVIAVGNEVRDIVEGDVVLVPVYAGQPLFVDDKYYRTIYEGEVYGIVRESE